jgi:WD40 repeat protein
MSRERVVVVLEYRIYVYNFSDLNLLHTIETISNPHGLCALCADSRACVIACCGLQKGHVRAELFDITRTTLISAHEAALSCIALNTDGTRLATGACRQPCCTSSVALKRSSRPCPVTGEKQSPLLLCVAYQRSTPGHRRVMGELTWLWDS